MSEKRERDRNAEVLSFDLLSRSAKEMSLKSGYVSIEKAFLCQHRFGLLFGKHQWKIASKTIKFRMRCIGWAGGGEIQS